MLRMIGPATWKVRPLTDRPSIEYLKERADLDVKFVAHGSLKIDGKSVNCGKRPTVMNPNFDSWGGAFPGFVILNNKKISGLSTEVKLYIYSHECGHQFEGPDETKADLFAIRRGVKWGWLDAQGMEDICTFISTAQGRFGASAWPATLRDHAQILSGADRGRYAAGGLKLVLRHAGANARPRAIV